MRFECPFCWGHNVKEIASAGGNGQAVDHMILCEECERWFWADTQEEVLDLAALCSTLICEPDKCIEEVIHPLHSGYLTYPAQKEVELNLLCSECPHRSFFLPGRPSSLSSRHESRAQQRFEQGRSPK
jgi:hypothetical protein